MTENYQFYLDTPYGYTIKVLIEVLQSCLQNEAYFQLEKTGIKLCCTDNRETTLINIGLKMENFYDYKCTSNKTIAVNLKHLHKLLKCVKKKDSIAIFINKDMPNKLGIRTVPITVEKKSERAETSFVSIREVTRSEIDVPQGYHCPKVIPSTDYQKMCKKMASVPGKVVTITIQQNNYLSFFCDGGDIMSSDMTFGKKDPNIKSIYEGKFYTTTLNQLIKMPGLYSRMQISAPKNLQFPIRIKMDAGHLGFIEVYLKEKSQIDYEEIERNKE